MTPAEAVLAVFVFFLLVQIWRFHPSTASSAAKTSLTLRRLTHGNGWRIAAIAMKLLVLVGTLSVGLSAAYGNMSVGQVASSSQLHIEELPPVDQSTEEDIRATDEDVSQVVTIWRIISLVSVFVGTILAWIFDDLATKRSRRKTESDVARVTGALAPVISKLAVDAADDVSDEEANRFGLGCAEALIRVMDQSSALAVRTCLYRYDRLTDDEDSDNGEQASMGVERLVRVGKFAGRQAGATPREKFSSEVEFDKKVIKKLRGGEHIRFDDLKFGEHQQIEEVGVDPKYEPGDLSRSYRSCVSVPVLDQRGELLGMISCDSKHPYAFTDQDVALMQFFTELVAAGFTIMSTGPTVTQRTGRTSRRNNAVSS